MLPAFHCERVAGYVDTMYRQAADLVASWRPGQVLDVEKEMYALSLNTVCEVLFSTSLSEEEIAEVGRCLPMVAEGVASRSMTRKALDGVPLLAHRRFDEAAGRLRGIVDRVVAQRRSAPGAEGMTERAEEGAGARMCARAYEDLIALLVEARDADTGAAMDNVQVRDEVIGLMLAGTGAIATSLAWALYEIGRGPDIARAVAAEVDALVGQGPIGYAEIAKLDYINRTITETTRLHPMLTFAARRATVPVEIGGVRFPAGAELMFSPYAAFRDPALFERPHRFDPDRWLPERAVGVPRESFIPFGAGARECVGGQFTEFQMAVAIGTIASRVSLLPLAGQPVSVVPGVLPRPGGLRMTAEPRMALAVARS